MKDDIAINLLFLLDRIDTLSDLFKPSKDNPIGYEFFYKKTMEIVESRHKILKSDGRYNLLDGEDNVVYVLETKDDGDLMIFNKS